MDEQQNYNPQTGPDPVNSADPNFANGIEYDAPMQPILSSSPDTEESAAPASQTNASKFFGGRSRASQIASSAPATNYRQNTPEFFSQAMNQNDIIVNNAQEQQQKSKKGLIIGGIIGGAVLVVAAVIAVVLLLPKEPTVTDPKQIVLNTFNDADVTAVNNFETRLNHIENDEIGTYDIFNEEFKKIVEDGVTSYRKIYDSLQSNTDYLKEHSSKDKITSLKAKMEANISQYEAAKADYLLVYDAIVNGNNDKIDQVSSERVKESAKQLIEAAATIREVEAAFDTVDCDNAQVLDYATGYDECDALEDKEETASAIIEESSLAESIFFGENPDKVKENIAKDLLNDIYVGSKEAGETNDEKQE